MKKILITGSNGFIGNSILKKCSNLKYEIKTINSNCEDYFKVADEVFDHVFHMASYREKTIGVKNCKISNFSYDSIIDSYMFSWALRTKQKNIIYFSSSAAYPVALQNSPKYCLKESDIDMESQTIGIPDGMYGWTKLSGEKMANFLNKNGIKVNVFRPFSVYGESQSETFIFKNFLNLIKNKSDIIYIWGDGTQTRDFVYIDDVIDCVFSVIDNEISSPLNIGTGTSLSINDFLNTMLYNLNYKPKKIIHLLDKDFGCKFRCADISEMSKVYKIKYNLSNIIKNIRC